MPFKDGQGPSDSGLGVRNEVVPIVKTGKSFIAPATEARGAKAERARISGGLNGALESCGVFFREAGDDLQIHSETPGALANLLDKARVERSEFGLNASGAERGTVIHELKGGVAAPAEAKGINIDAHRGAR